MARLAILNRFKARSNLSSNYYCLSLMNSALYVYKDKDLTKRFVPMLQGIQNRLKVCSIREIYGTLFTPSFSEGIEFVYISAIRGGTLNPS